MADVGEEEEEEEEEEEMNSNGMMAMALRGCVLVLSELGGQTQSLPIICEVCEVAIQCIHVLTHIVGKPSELSHTVSYKTRAVVV